MSPIPGIIASSQTGGLVTGSFESIATATGTGSSNTITFSSIPSGYSSLQIRFIGKTVRTTNTRAKLTLTFNGSATTYAFHALTGNGTTASATGTASTTNIDTVNTFIPSSQTGLANMFGVGIIDIIDYTSTSKAKTVRMITGTDVNGSTGGSFIALNSGLWYATPAAITSISLVTSDSSWTTTSVFALYGVK